MGFQIHTEEGKPVNIGTLDQEACKLWGVPGQSKYYAYPQYRERLEDESESEYYKNVINWMGMNWFDTIGFTIHCDKRITWDGIRLELIDMWSTKEFSAEELCPQHFALIQHWEDKGYQPKPV